MLFIIQACRKFDFLSKAKDEFTTEDAKEWYYGTFKKTNAFYGNDHQSLFAGGLKSSSLAKSTNPTYKKYPYWDKGVSYRKGEYEIVEAPLFRELNIIAIPGMEYLSYNEKKQVVDAALQKVVFIKKADNSVAIRVLTIIPTYNYLRTKGYDISDNTFSDLDPEFSGLVSIRTCQETSVNFLSYKDGKYEKSISIIKKGREILSNSNIETASSSSGCGWVPIPIIKRYCIATTGSNGDVPPDDANCTEWEEYETGEVDFQYVPCESEDGSGDPFLDCLMGNNPDNCVCTVYGLDCGGGDNPPGDGGGDDTEDLIDSLTIQLQEPCFINTISNLNINNGLRSQIGSILHSCFPNWTPNDFSIEQKCYSDTLLDAKHYTSASTGGPITIKLNECAINNASQEYVAATLFHELLHAFFTTQGKMSELQQHESMATAYVDALKSTLLDYFPSLSNNEALALAWGGLEGTTAWQNKVQGNPALVNTYKTLSDNHRWGNSGTNCK
jgi:hypothetical protein